jgi:hypothetical protein
MCICITADPSSFYINHRPTDSPDLFIDHFKQFVECFMIDVRQCTAKDILCVFKAFENRVPGELLKERQSDGAVNI